MVVPSFFPLLVSLFWHDGVLAWAALKFFLFSLVALSPVLVYFCMIGLFRRIEAALIAMFFTANLLFVWIGNSILTEIPFVVLLYGGLLLTARSKGFSKQPETVLATLCWLFISRTRVIGTCFLAVCLIMLIAKRRYIVALIALSAFLVWLAGEHLAVDANLAVSSHLSNHLNRIPIFTSPAISFSRLFALYEHNMTSFAGSMYANILAPYFYSLVPMNKAKRAIVLCVFAFGCLGAITVWKRRKSYRPFVVAILLSCVPIFTWERVAQIFRYLFPFYPFLLAALLVSLHRLLERNKYRLVRSVPLFVLVIVVGNQAIATLGTIQRDPEQEAFASLHSFISHHDEKIDLLLSPISHYSYLRTGIPSQQVRYGSDLVGNAPLYRGVDSHA